MSHSTRPGSTVPEREAITSPSSGVKPMVVSTDRPSRTAHSDDPAPRWQVTSRATGPAGEALGLAGGPAWDRPWKPKRRTASRSRHASGTA